MRSKGAENTSFVRRVRTMNATDVPEAVTFIQRYYPIMQTFARRLPGLLERLIFEEALSGVVVEYVYDDFSAEFAAFGLSGFITEASATAYLTTPTPYLWLSLLHRVLENAQESAFLTFDEIAQANAGEGLNLVVLPWLQHTHDPADPEAHILWALALDLLLRNHRGYRLKRILKDVPAEMASPHMRIGFLEYCRLPAGTPLSFLPAAALEREYVVFAVNRSDVEGQWPGTPISHLFANKPPRCKFTRLEQQVLLRAADGLKDAKIAEVLDIGIWAVAMRWRSIYTRVSQHAPSVLSTDEYTDGTRGQEKRRLVLAFVNEHPEELRPYANCPRRQAEFAG